MFDNKFFIGVTQNGYFVTLPIRGEVSDDDMMEVAALVLIMKPANREKFEAAMKRMRE